MRDTSKSKMGIPNYSNLPYERLRLTTGSGSNERVPFVSGLNWGQRPGRNQDQAYLPVPSDIQRTDFFPPVGEVFQMVTDDNELWVCARRQANGKAIHTIKDNSIIGKYFRRRLGLESGDLITLNHLLNYGKTCVEIYKVSKNYFVMDFTAY